MSYVLENKYSAVIQASTAAYEYLNPSQPDSTTLLAMAAVSVGVVTEPVGVVTESVGVVTEPVGAGFEAMCAPKPVDTVIESIGVTTELVGMAGGGSGGIGLGSGGGEFSRVGTNPCDGKVLASLKIAPVII